MAQQYGPENASLRIRTGRTGGAAKAGHDQLIEVESWQATLDREAQPALTLTADSRSLRVLEGTGGINSLTDKDRADIKKTIDKEVLKGCAIEFRSTQVEPNGDRTMLSVQGELELGGRRGPVTFELATADGPQPSFCDLEDHNALTAYQERRRLAQDAAGDETNEEDE